MDIDLSKINSHPDKPLPKHIGGVLEKVQRRTANLPTTLNLKLAEIAALFHDLGKINPNFQRKLKGEKNVGYSSHAYLSVYGFVCFCAANRDKLAAWTKRSEQFFALLAIIARHHGNLPDFEEKILNPDETKRLADFLAANTDLPLCGFMQFLNDYPVFDEFIKTQNVFALDVSPKFQEKIFGARVLIEHNQSPLEFFLETQFSFACLLEADKRDAGENEVYKRRDLRESYFAANFADRIEERLSKFAVKENKSPLDVLRTAMREEAVGKLREKLKTDERVFTLAAPTGAGKTMMLLALAKEILAQKPYLSVVYTLPFLSITEQVENECRKIFHDNRDAILRIDSRAENPRIQELQEKLDAEQTDENLTEILKENFSEFTFDHPFIVTTFVQIFETLLSNRNARLLRLPNFSKTVFLIDEIQALPYRLYSFFTAFLQEFCQHFDAYAIISTATMPHLDFPSTEIAGRKIFANYEKPFELIDAPKYFAQKVFNRYRVTRIEQENFRISDLADFVQKRDESCLIILNTINDTKDLYKHLSEIYSTDECVLLNTHFTLEDRRAKIEHCQKKLKISEKIILISTQLIEAGVDIDFPTVYRDFCPLPSLIQSAGRCNRNGELEFGEVFFFALQKENGKLPSELIYRDEAKNFLEFCRTNLTETVTESDLFDLQKRFFQIEIGENLRFGLHKQSNYQEGKIDLVESINKAAFDQLGKFRLIDEKDFGKEFRYYIPRSFNDDSFEKLQELADVKQSRNFEEAKSKQIKIEDLVRKMSSRIVTFRLRDENDAPTSAGEVFKSEYHTGIRKLDDLEDYSSREGIKLGRKGGCII
jgi:CRISPR-associated endonuclease/helicase Cas3